MKKILKAAAIGLGCVCILATLIFTLFDFKPRQSEKEDDTFFCEYVRVQTGGEEGSSLRVTMERKGSRTIGLTLEKGASDGTASTTERYVPTGVDGKLRDLWEEYDLGSWGELSLVEEREDGNGRSVHIILGKREFQWDDRFALPENGEAFLQDLCALLSEYAKEPVS